MNYFSLTTESLPTWARYYGSLGWPIFPCRGKAPLTPNGCNDASADADQIDAWWERWPDANIALRPSQEHWVLDADPRHNSQATLDAWQREHGAPLFPAALLVHSGRGEGTHWHFSNRAGALIQHAASVGQGIDILAKVGALLPPSIHPDSHRPYRWAAATTSFALMDAPAWLVALVSAPPPKRLATVGTPGEAIPQGQRESTLLKMGGGLRRQGATPAEILTALTAINGRCDPPLAERDVHRLASSLGRYAPEGNSHQDGPRSHSGSEGDPSPKMGGNDAPVPSLGAPVALSHLATRSLDGAVEKDAQWLWWPYLALGTIAMLDGDPGIGKSLLTLQLAASLSRGYPLPDQVGAPTGAPVAPAHSLFFAREDSLEYTVKRRVRYLDADQSRIHYVDGVVHGEAGAVQPFTLADLPALEWEMEQYHPRLVVLDPIQAYLGAKLDMNRANETRPLLDRLSALAEREQCTILCVRHPAKASGEGGGKAMMRGLGSVDFIGAARTGLFVEAHPLDANMAMLAQTKNNLGPIGRTQIYSKEDGHFQWAGVTRMSAEVLAGNGRGPDPRAFLEAFMWLERRLEGGIAVPVSDLFLQGEHDIDVSEKVLRKARRALGIVARQATNGWEWRLPSLPLHTIGISDATGSTGSSGVTGIDHSLLPPLYTIGISDDTGSTGVTGSTGSSGLGMRPGYGREADDQRCPDTPDTSDDPVGPVAIARARDAQSVPELPFCACGEKNWQTSVVPPRCVACGARMQG